jgi:hypothetical protein
MEQRARLQLQRIKRLPRQVLVLAVIAVVILIGSLILIWQLVHLHSHTDHTGVPADLTRAATIVHYPLYYPSPLPVGWKLEDHSLQITGEYANFALLGTGIKVTVNEQPKPINIEQVKKIKEFDTGAGHAYIADLEGHTVGFLATDKTLVNITGANSSQNTELEELLRSLRKL